jgi:hypothetical protein
MQLRANAATFTQHHTDEEAGYKFAGLLIVSLFPALFWTTVVAGIGSVVGHTPSAATLIAFGTSVAAFLALVWQALTRSYPET